MCRDGTVLTVATQRSFRVRSHSEGEDGGVLILERTSRTTLRGANTRGEDTTSVEGSGTGTMTLVVHALTGLIVSGDGSGTLDIVIQARTKSERARQVLQSRIMRRPG
jgi:hypothetical protein